MIPGYHDHEKFVQTHRQNLLNEAPAVAPHKATRASKASQADN